MIGENKSKILKKLKRKMLKAFKEAGKKIWYPYYFTFVHPKEAERWKKICLKIK